MELGNPWSSMIDQPISADSPRPLLNQSLSNGYNLGLLGTNGIYEYNNQLMNSMNLLNSNYGRQLLLQGQAQMTQTPLQNINAIPSINKPIKISNKRQRPPYLDEGNNSDEENICNNKLPSIHQNKLQNSIAARPVNRNVKRGLDQVYPVNSLNHQPYNQSLGGLNPLKRTKTLRNMPVSALSEQMLNQNNEDNIMPNLGTLKRQIQTNSLLTQKIREEFTKTFASPSCSEPYLKFPSSHLNRADIIKVEPLPDLKLSNKNTSDNCQSIGNSLSSERLKLELTKCFSSYANSSQLGAKKVSALGPLLSDFSGNSTDNDQAKLMMRKKRRRMCINGSCEKFAQGTTKFCVSHGGGRRCAFEHCKKSAAGITKYCIGHGGGKRCCKPNCPKSAISPFMFCFAHGGGRRCKVEGCQKGARGSTQFCIGHGGGRRCKITNCGRSDQGSGFCIGHGGHGKRCAYPKCAKTIQGTAHYCPSHS